VRAPKVAHINCLSTLITPGAIANAGFPTSASVWKLNLLKNHVMTGAVITAAPVTHVAPAILHATHAGTLAVNHVNQHAADHAVTAHAAAPAPYHNGASGLKVDLLTINRI